MMWDGEWSDGAGTGALLLCALFVVALSGGIVAMLMLAVRHPERPGADAKDLGDPDGSERILRRRFAAGEIDEEEFLRRARVLEHGRSGPHDG